MASLHLRVPGQLVYVGGGFMPARLLVVPVGARLPPGVHAVAVAAVPATAGSGSRRAMGLVAHGVPSGVVGSLSLHGAGVVPIRLSIDDDSTGAGAAAGGGPALFLRGDASPGFGISSAALAGAGGRASRAGGLVVAAMAGSDGEGLNDNVSDSNKAFHEFIITQGLDALGAVDALVPPTVKYILPTELSDVKHDFKNAVMLAAQRSEDKKSCALKIMKGWYGVVQLTRAAAYLPPLPDHQAFIAICLAPDAELPPVILGQAVPPLSTPLPPHVSKTDADLIRAVLVAVAVCKAAARDGPTLYIQRLDD